jgi:ribonuclease HII
VVAAACVLPANVAHPAYVRDSKTLTEKGRETAQSYIKRVALGWAIGTASVEEIDRVNILNATMLAMHRALDAVYEQVAFQHICVDGPIFRPAFRDVPHTCVVGGDATHANISAASILAKCARDALVCTSVRDDPSLAPYGFASHKGYGTPAHLRALQTHGVTPYHRRTFAPVAKLL